MRFGRVLARACGNECDRCTGLQLVYRLEVCHAILCHATPGQAEVHIET
jgi:hypothetical protein